MATMKNVFFFVKEIFISMCRQLRAILIEWLTYGLTLNALPS